MPAPTGDSRQPGQPRPDARAAALRGKGSQDRQGFPSCLLPGAEFGWEGEASRGREPASPAPRGHRGWGGRRDPLAGRGGPRDPLPGAAALPANAASPHDGLEWMSRGGRGPRDRAVPTPAPARRRAGTAGRCRRTACWAWDRPRAASPVSAARWPPAAAGASEFRQKVNDARAGKAGAGCGRGTGDAASQRSFYIFHSQTLEGTAQKMQLGSGAGPSGLTPRLILFTLRMEKKS